MKLPVLLLALLARLEPRHWVALGASVVLHLAVYLGMDSPPPPEPRPVSFEIALEPPKPEAPTRAKSQVKTKTADAKAKKTQAKRKPAQREPHTLEAKWRGEARPAKDAPKLELPDARTLGVQAPLEEIVKPAATTRPTMAKVDAKPEAVQTTESPAAAQSAAQTTSQVAEAAQLADPGAGSGSLASAGGSAGDPGIALAASSSLSRGGLHPGGLSRSGQGAEARAGLAASGAAGQTGAGSGNLASSASAGSGMQIAAGSGAQSQSSLEAPALTGGEPQGIRLTATGTLAERAQLPAGAGALAAGPVAPESGRAAPHQAQGDGTSLASARAGGAAALPQTGADKQAGGGASTHSGSAAARAAGVAPGKLARVGDGGKDGPSSATTRAKAKVAGGAASERGTTAAGDGSGAGRALVASLGSADPSAAGNRRTALSAPTGGPGSSQSGKSLGLAPGEPGSSPNLAVTLPALVAKSGSGRGDRSGAGAGAGMAAGGAGSGGAYPGTGALRSGSADGGGASRSGLALAGGQGAATAVPAGMRAIAGGQGGTGGGAASGSGSGHASPGMDQDGARLVAIKVADRQIMRADSQLQALDVLAPSIYCPLPLPGHSFPDNRPPKPDVQVSSQPAYAPDNPSFIFPIQAWAGSIQGKAIVRVEVQPDGKPGRMWLKQSSGSGLLDRDAQSQLTFWRFIPARKNGQPVTAWIDVPVVYRLQDAKK